MPIAHINGINLAYELHGSGTPLLLIMGLSTSRTAWRFQVEAFAAQHRTILFDNRGIGESDQPDGPYTMAQLAADAVGLLDHLGIRGAHVFGVSMGGMVAQRLALDYPDRVLGLVLGCTTCGADEHVFAEQWVTDFLLNSGTQSREDRIREGLKIIFSPTFIDRQPERIELMLQLGLDARQSEIGYRGQLAAILSHATCARLAEISAPTLVIHGADDALIPAANGRLLAERIPDARLLEIEGAGHGFQVEQPELVNEAVLKFLAEVDRREPTVRATAPIVSQTTEKQASEGAIMTDFETISVKQYFEEYLPKRFAEASVEVGGYTLQFHVGGSVYAYRVGENRELELIPGGVAAPLMEVRMNEADWRDSITGRVAAGLARAEPGRISADRLRKLRDLRGTFVVELRRDNADAWRATTVFNNAAAPAVTLRMAADDYAAMERGDLNSQMAFMTGKLKFQGDLGLLMKLSTLLT